MIEISQNINPIQISEHGEVIKYKQKVIDNSNEYELEVERSINNDMYSLSSISKLLHIELSILNNFINSQRFNFILSCFDSSYKIPQFVYFIVFDGFVKIGRTFDLKQRYNPSQLNENVKRIIFVKNVNIVEKELKETFKKKFQKFYISSDERFIIPNKKIKSALKVFDNAVNSYNIRKIENKHIKQYHHDKTYGSGYFVSPIVCSILISIYCNIDFKLCKNFINTIEHFYNRINKNDFIATFKECRNNFQYWKYNGYVIIVNITNNTVNISRLWKTIIQTDYKKKLNNMKLWKFLQKTTIQRLIKSHELRFESIKYKNKPLLNGKWGSLIFVHIILYELNAKYMIKVAKMLTEMIFNRKIEIDNYKSIKGGNIINNKNILDILAENYEEFEKMIKS